MTIRTDGYTWRKLETGTSVPSRERELAATQPSPVVVYHWSREQIEQYMRERYGEEYASMPTNVTKEEYLRLRAQGLSRTQILAQLHISPSVLYRLLEQWGIKRQAAEAEALAAMCQKPSVSTAEEEPSEKASSGAEEPKLTLTLEQQIFRALLQSVITDVHTTARAKGWHDTPVPLPVHLALIHSEVSEALEADRKQMGTEKVAEELADVVIRVMDTAAAHGLDLAGALLAKMARNKTREYRHGGLKY